MNILLTQKEIDRLAKLLNIQAPMTYEEFRNYADQSMKDDIERTEEMISNLDKQESMYDVIASVLIRMQYQYPQIPQHIYFSLIYFGMCLAGKE